MRTFLWLLRAFIFFALFAFALNNQQKATIHWFFGVEWQAPMVIVVLAAFAAGCAVGVLAMVPGWWRQRQRAQRHAADRLSASAPPTPNAGSAELPPEHPPRDGL